MGTCRECERLWHDYAEAVKAALKMASSRQVAEIGQDSAALSAIEPAYQAALERRDQTRTALRAHAATNHKTQSARA